MKSTDYAPRAAAMDVYLMGGRNLKGIEVGCDIGAHAEAIMTYLSIDTLYLIDIWEKEWCKGFCEGRLSKWKNNVQYFKANGIGRIATEFKENFFDFVYIDIPHDYETVKQSLLLWWNKIKSGGILGYRNYTTCQKAIDEFVQANNIKFEVDKYHNEIIMFK